MKAWRFYELGDLRLDDVEEPTPGPADALVRVRVVQPSVTEAILASGGETAGADAVRTRLATPPAALFGHEYCGEVIALGAAVEHLAVGDRVVDTATRPCLDCALCASGRHEECRRGVDIGWDVPGALAELACVPASGLVPVPEAVDDYSAAALQPAADCVAAVESAGVAPDDTVAIIGQGVMGLHTLQLSRHAGARVLAVDVLPGALALARELGADETIDASDRDPVGAVRALTDGIGADVTVDSAGGPSQQGLAGSGSIGQALDMTRDSGRVLVNSLIPGGVPIDVNAWRVRSVSLVFPRLGAPRHLASAVELAAAGSLRVDPLISHIARGIEAVPESFEITADKRSFDANGPCQVVIDPSVCPHERLGTGNVRPRARTDETP